MRKLILGFLGSMMVVSVAKAEMYHSEEVLHSAACFIVTDALNCRAEPNVYSDIMSVYEEGSEITLMKTNEGKANIEVVKDDDTQEDSVWFYTTRECWASANVRYSTPGCE